MKNKIYKKVGLLSISALAALSLSVPVKAEQSCKQYANYYFFSEINEKSYFSGKGETVTLKTGTQLPALPSGAKVIENGKTGKICLWNGDNDCAVTDESWDLDKFYKEIKNGIGTNDCYDKGCPQGNNVNYFGGASWYFINDDKPGQTINEGQNYSTHEIADLITGTIQPRNTYITRNSVDNSDKDEFQVTREHTVSDDGNTIDGNNQSFDHKWSEKASDAQPTVLAPALYKVTYELCTDTPEEKFKSEIEYIDKDTKKEVHEPYQKGDLSNGYKEGVDSPKVDGCKLVDKNDSTVNYQIDNADYHKIVYYNCEVSDPGKTGNALIFVAWIVGFGSLGYSIYWFKKNKKEEV